MDEFLKTLQDTGYGYYDQLIKEELKSNMREYLLNWSKQFNRDYQMAVYSAISGAYDDIEKDIRRNKYTAQEAILILDLMLKYDLISKFVRDCKAEKWEGLR
jgi:hypothetical protein